METQKEYYYTYYSYEEWGRGYFGSRKCYCLPEEDVRYLGSSKDKTFRPTQKIILKSDYATREEAYADEIILQQYYNVVENPHFANKAYQTSTRFYIPKERAIQLGKEAGRRTYELGIGVFGRTKKQISEDSRKAGQKTYELSIGVHGRSKEEMIEQGRINGKKVYELKLGAFARDREKIIEDSRKGGMKVKELKVGVCGLSKEQRKENSKITNSQKWECCITGYVSTAAGVVSYQKGKGIDTTKNNRRRIS